MADEADDLVDPDRDIETLDRHGVEYLLVGGLAARAHGAERQTSDIDCAPNTTVESLEHMAAALVELDGRLRVGLNFGSSTWMTDARPLDLLVE